VSVWRDSQEVKKKKGEAGEKGEKAVIPHFLGDISGAIAFSPLPKLNPQTASALNCVSAYTFD
jgi:hypothetical protein